jgi:hypothetical protein
MLGTLVSFSRPQLGLAFKSFSIYIMIAGFFRICLEVGGLGLWCAVGPAR